jgi:two-component system cell cycle response regulator DivK
MGEPEQVHTIVYIEADADNRQLVRRVLATTGRYEVETASDGVSGLEQIREHRPVLALVDLDLPVISPFELLRRLQTDPEIKQIPVVAVSASIMRGERQRCLDAGFLSFIEKPFDIHELRAMIDICVERALQKPQPQTERS